MSSGPWVPLVAVGLVAAPAAGGDLPTRCMLRWTGPTPTCALRDTVRTDAIGRDEASARALAAERLPRVIESARQHGAFLLGAEDRQAFLAATEGCAEVPTSEAVVSCFPEPELTEARTCWLSVPGFACGDGRGLRIRGRPWREGEAAREDLCDGYAERARRATAPDVPLACAVACWQSARLQCGAGDPAP